MLSNPSYCLTPASQLEARSLQWLWPNRLALGHLAILDGDPQMGKSFVALDLCARLSAGRPFPDGAAGPGPGSCIILNGEDGKEDTIRVRLQSLGADMDQVHILHPRDNAFLLRLPSEIAVLDEAISQTGARLVVIDPIIQFLESGVQINNDQSVRRALTLLIHMAEMRGCVILLLRHLNKQGNWRSLYRGGGSVGVIAACRSGWLIALDPRDPTIRVFAQTKTNVEELQPSLSFRIEKQESGSPLLTWLEPVPWTADQLLAAAAKAPKRPGPRTRAREFLKSFLESQPRTSREIWDGIKKEELAPRTIDRAKRELDIRSIHVSQDGKRLVYWLLPGQQLPPELNYPDLEPWLAPLREQFPPATPLDDL
jgi:hypothetical protein